MKIKLSGYDDFKCAADKCTMTCCMQWKIAVDKETRKKWKLTVYDGKSLDSHVVKKDGQDVIKLNKDKFCPFLNSEKLCNLVLNYGDEILSDTCDKFPRQIHEFDGVTEYSLVSCCPAVVDMFNETDEIAFDKENLLTDTNISIRNILINILKDDNISITTGLLMAFYIMLDIYDGYDNEDDICLKEYEDKDALSELKSMIDSRISDVMDTLMEDNEIWLDIAENYRNEKLYTEYIEDISLMAMQLENTSGNTGKTEALRISYMEFCEGMRQYEKLFRNFLVAELFTNLYVPKSDILGMLVKLQWIAMEFTSIRHGIFLKYLKTGEQAEYETVRDMIVVISRMMGYDEEDIFEYMENSFESVVWEWGYMAFILGK